MANFDEGDDCEWTLADSHPSTLGNCYHENARSISSCVARMSQEHINICNKVAELVCDTLTRACEFPSKQRQEHRLLAHDKLQLVLGSLPKLDYVEKVAMLEVILEGAASKQTGVCQISGVIRDRPLPGTLENDPSEFTVLSAETGAEPDRNGSVEPDYNSASEAPVFCNAEDLPLRGRYDKLCILCGFVGSQLPRHVRQCHWKPVRSKKNKATISEVKARNCAIMKRVVNSAAKQAAYLLAHQIISEHALNSVFHDRDTIDKLQFRDILNRLGMLVVPDHLLPRSCFAKYGIPSKTPFLHRDIQPVEPFAKQRLVTSPASDSYPEEVVTESIASTHTVEDFEALVSPQERELSGYPLESELPESLLGLDEELSDDEPLILSDVGREYKQGMKHKQYEIGAYVQFNPEHPSNALLREFRRESIEELGERPKNKTKGSFENSVTTTVNHVAAFLHWAWDKGGSGIPVCASREFCRSECVQRSLRPWLFWFRDEGASAQQIKQRGVHLKQFFGFLARDVQSRNDGYGGVFERMASDAAYYGPRAASSAIIRYTKKQSLMLAPEMFRSLKSCLAYKGTVKFKEWEEYMWSVINDAEFPGFLNEIGGGPWNLKCQEGARLLYNYVIGRMLSIVLLEQAQRPEVMEALTVFEFLRSRRHSALVGDDVVVYVFKHKTARAGNRPATFSLRPEEREIFDFYFDVLRPCLSSDVSDSAPFLVSLCGGGLSQRCCQKLHNWQEQLYDGDQTPVSVTQVRTAVETLSQDPRYVVEPHNRETICSYLNHRMDTARRFYDMEVKMKVVVARNLIDQLLVDVREACTPQLSEARLPGSPGFSEELDENEGERHCYIYT